MVMSHYMDAYSSLRATSAAAFVPLQSPPECVAAGDSNRLAHAADQPLRARRLPARRPVRVRAVWST